MRVTTLAGCLALAATLAPGAQTRPRTLAFEQRVRAQAAIERVYYAHQIGATRPFEEAIPRSVLEKKVRTYLEETVALDTVWKTRITAEMLRREMGRIEARTRMPERLRQLYAALGDDPFLIQECLARPALVDRLARSFFAYDATIHAKTRHEAEALRQDLVDKRLDPWSDHADRIVANLVRLDDGGAVRGAEARGRPSAGREKEIELASATFEREVALLPSLIGDIGQVVEEPEAFVTRVVLQRDEDTIKVAAFTVPKLSWEDWWASIEGDLRATSVKAVATEDLSLPLPAHEDAALPSSAPCPPDDVWESVFSEMPDARTWHTAVWTGSLMIVWGGSNGTSLNTGGRYDPAIGVWTPTSTANAPSPRSGHTAVWTGSMMVVWGGTGNDGGRYDPASDTWTPTSTANAPSPRSSHSAVWTGSRMIVWGGLWGDPWYYGSYLHTGGQYDPATDSWTPTSTFVIPRAYHTAVWTGTEMIVWGGIDSDGGPVPDDGGLYDPATDSWRSMSSTDEPSYRYGHTAVWTGNIMIVWGGYDFSGLTNTGGRYDPASNTWTPTSTANAPSPRSDHTAVWTANLMFVWGGYGGSVLNTGGRYDPDSDTWSPTSMASAPLARAGHSGVWTGSLMIVWGGYGHQYLNSGGRYDPLTEAWTMTFVTDTPSPRELHTAVWTGNEMIVWGGFDGSDLNTGGRYDPVTDTWSPTSTASAPTGRSRHTSVWTGNLMVVWGGTDAASLHTTGGGYDPVADTWSPTTPVAEPTRSGHTAVWTGSEMIVWGGDLGGSYTGTGGRYDPSADTWTPTSILTAPAARVAHTAVWADTMMIVWGGCVDRSGTCPNTGGRYDPATDTWAPTSTGPNVPPTTTGHTAIWTGSEMIVWSGLASPGGPFATGGHYDPSTDTWRGTAFGPLGRSSHTAVWTGSEMVVWGGRNPAASVNTGGRYYPALGTWLPMSTTNAPLPRFGHTAVWTGSEMIVWGGSVGSTGGRYAIAPFVDGDMDGRGMCQGDCDDGKAAIHPGAAEVCDNLDNDCDGVVDSFATYCGRGQCSSTGSCTAGVNSCVPGSPSAEVCDDVDNDCDGVADDFPPPTGSPVVAVEAAAGSIVLGWASLPDATEYDVVMGDLQALIATIGEFTAAIQACLADDRIENTLTLSDTPATGAGYFYLVRGVNCGILGTYDSGDPGQVGSRDAEINASFLSCPAVPPFCGDGTCNEPEEDYINCPSDCDFCPFQYCLGWQAAEE